MWVSYSIRNRNLEQCLEEKKKGKYRSICLPRQQYSTVQYSTYMNSLPIHPIRAIHLLFVPMMCGPSPPQQQRARQPCTRFKAHHDHRQSLLPTGQSFPNWNLQLFQIWTSTDFVHTAHSGSRGRLENVSSTDVDGARTADGARSKAVGTAPPMAPIHLDLRVLPCLKLVFF